tara:strand:+ start:776 stop:1108 length:333 start_codon:yes stop_codon:yes gene_type:complete
MNKTTKILLSIPTIVGFILLLSVLITDLENWIDQYILNVEELAYLTLGLLIVQFVILTFRIWSFKNVDRNKKGEETFYLFSLNIIAAVHYIWKTDRKLIDLNKKTTHNNV